MNNINIFSIGNKRINKRLKITQQTNCIPLMNKIHQTFLFVIYPLNILNSLFTHYVQDVNLQTTFNSAQKTMFPFLYPNHYVIKHNVQELSLETS